MVFDRVVYCTLVLCVLTSASGVQETSPFCILESIDIDGIVQGVATSDISYNFRFVVEGKSCRLGNENFVFQRDHSHTKLFAVSVNLSVCLSQWGAKDSVFASGYLKRGGNRWTKCDGEMRTTGTRPVGQPSATHYDESKLRKGLYYEVTRAAG